MTYFCTECKKHHANNYKKHWKYKKGKGPELKTDDPNNLRERVDTLEKRVWLITGILKDWRMYIDRKHPYVGMYEEAFKNL